MMNMQRETIVTDVRINKNLIVHCGRVVYYRAAVSPRYCFDTRLRVRENH